MIDFCLDSERTNKHVPRDKSDQEARKPLASLALALNEPNMGRFFHLCRRDVSMEVYACSAHWEVLRKKDVLVHTLRSCHPCHAIEARRKE